MFELATQYTFKNGKSQAVSHILGKPICYLKGNVPGKSDKVFKRFILLNQHFPICNSSQIFPQKNRIPIYSRVLRSFKIQISISRKHKLQSLDDNITQKMGNVTTCLGNMKHPLLPSFFLMVQTCFDNSF